MDQGKNRGGEGAENGISGASLGIYAKSQATLIRINDLGSGDPITVDPDTGEVVKGVSDVVSSRLERFALQSVARSILPQSRTAKCLRVPFKRGHSVEVWRSIEHSSAFFGGLQICSSVWACPVCSAKISERRRVEVASAIASCEALGGSVLLLTLTHPHNRADALGELLEAEQRALASFFGSGSVKRLLGRIGRVGQIRAWEVTHGRKRELNNGWHPHFHILLFLDGSLSAADRLAVESELYRAWAAACVRSGLESPSRRHGIKLDDGAQAAAYVAKMGLEAPRWGMDRELTKGHSKRAKDGETPFDLLRSVLADRADGHGRALFREYAQAFRGKRQLVWSRGLRELLGFGAVASDAEVAAAHEDDAVLLAKLTADDWRAVLRCEGRGELLEVARHGVEALERWLVTVRGAYGQATI